MIGDRIREIRKANNLSQQAFAKLFETSSGYISEVEQGKKTPGGDFFCSLRRVFGVDLNWILAGEEGASEFSKLLTIPQGRRWIVDKELLELIITTVDEFLDKENLELSPDRKFKVYQHLYEMFEEKHEVEPEVVIRTLRLVA